jgi:hypothetical protein
MRELTMDEVQDVNGGVPPLIVAIGAVLNTQVSTAVSAAVIGGAIALAAWVFSEKS